LRSGEETAVTDPSAEFLFVKLWIDLPLRQQKDAQHRARSGGNVLVWRWQRELVSVDAKRVHDFVS
jgi:hypothetical protein